MQFPAKPAQKAALSFFQEECSQFQTNPLLGSRKHLAWHELQEEAFRRDDLFSSFAFTFAISCIFQQKGKKGLRIFRPRRFSERRGQKESHCLHHCRNHWSGHHWPHGQYHKQWRIQDFGQGGPAEFWPQGGPEPKMYRKNRGVSLKIAWKLHDFEKKILGAREGPGPPGFAGDKPLPQPKSTASCQVKCYAKALSTPLSNAMLLRSWSPDAGAASTMISALISSASDDWTQIWIYQKGILFADCEEIAVNSNMLGTSNFSIALTVIETWLNLLENWMSRHPSKPGDVLEIEAQNSSQGALSVQLETNLSLRGWTSHLFFDNPLRPCGEIRPSSSWLFYNCAQGPRPPPPISQKTPFSLRVQWGLNFTLSSGKPGNLRPFLVRIHQGKNIQDESGNPDPVLVDVDGHGFKSWFGETFLALACVRNVEKSWVSFSNRSMMVLFLNSKARNQVSTGENEDSLSIKPKSVHLSWNVTLQCT